MHLDPEDATAPLSHKPAGCETVAGTASTSCDPVQAGGHGYGDAFMMVRLAFFTALTVPMHCGHETSACGHVNLAACFLLAATGTRVTRHPGYGPCRKKSNRRSGGSFRSLAMQVPWKGWSYSHASHAYSRRVVWLYRDGF